MASRLLAGLVCGVLWLMLSGALAANLALATPAGPTPRTTLLHQQADDGPQDITAAALQWLDASGERTLADWLQQFNTGGRPAGTSAGGFDWLGVSPPPLGRRGGAVWLAVPLHNPQAALLRHLEVAPLRLERVDAWLLEASPGVVAQPLGRSGLSVALALRPLTASALAWPVTLPPGACTLLLRIQSRTPMQPQLTLWQPTTHALVVRQNDLYQGLEAGALALAGLLALVLAGWLREASWAWYGAANISTLIYQACFNGMAVLWLWPMHPQWTLPALALALAGAHLSWVMFFLRFIQPASQHAWARVMAIGLAGLSLLGLGLVLVQGFGAGIGLQEVAALLLPLVLPWLAWHAWRSNDQAARFLLLSYGLVAAASILRVAVVRGWLLPAPWLEYWFLPLATILTTVAMMLALADRLRVLSRQQVQQAQQHQQTLQARIGEATTELMQARDEARAAVQFKSRFLARVSHDLRTPLHTLLSHAAVAQQTLNQGLTDRAGLDLQRLLALLQGMERSGHDILQLSDELLELVRGEAGRLTLVTAPCHLPTLAQALISAVQWLARQRGCQLQLTLELALPDLLLDAARVQQVLRNLLTNACAATQDGSITLGLRSTAAPAAGMAWLDLWVADSGRGIAAADLNRIFEPFEQLDASRATGSAGLGLAIARQWVRLMGGDIAVQSSPGVGSVFSWRIQVPMVPAGMAGKDTVRAAMPSGDAPCQQMPPLAAATGALHGHVLVVDDCQADRQRLLGLLQGMGLQVSQASGGHAAAARLQQTAGPSAGAARRIDLVITDLQMPDGDGLFLLQWCRQQRPALAVLALSGSPQTPGVFDAVLLKPAHPGQLRTALQCLLPAPLDWAQLRALADGGDGLGVDGWIAHHRSQLGDGPLARGVIALGDSLQLAALVRWLS